MKRFLLLSSLFYSLAGMTQTASWQQALLKAASEHKYILLRFSGSDWCVPCIKMEKEIFEKEAFQNYAQDRLVLIQADFPRLKKHQLPKEKQLDNDALAEQYNKNGSFPLTLLVNEKGQVVKEWEGVAAESPQKFILELEAVQHVR